MSSGFLEPSDNTIDIELRSPDDIARRLVVLTSLVRRAALEGSDPTAGEQDAFERETDRFELYSWTMKELHDVVTSSELSLLQAPAGSLIQNDIDQCLACVIPAQALRWSLGAIDRLNPSDAPEGLVEALLAWSPGPWDELSRFGRTLGLRDEESIATERERWELWHWRATLEPADIDPHESLDDVVSVVTDEARSAGLVESAKGDFAVAGQPFRALPDEQRTHIAELAEGYLIALNWVCGFGDSWDDTPIYPE